MRQLYWIYPLKKICQTLSGKFEKLVIVENGKSIPGKSQISPEIFEVLSLAFPLSGHIMFVCSL
jgi:hypothetical protein